MNNNTNMCLRNRLMPPVVAAAPNAIEDIPIDDVRDIYDHIQDHHPNQVSSYFGCQFLPQLFKLDVSCLLLCLLDFT